VITAAKLRTRTVKDLAAMAKRKGVPGWHSMRKEQLVRALVRRARNAAAGRNGPGGAKKTAKRSSIKGKGAVPETAACSKQARSARSARIRTRLRKVKATLEQAKDLAHKSAAAGNGCSKDRLVAIVRDPYWLHAYWELTRQSVRRARAAMGQHWHAARPVLRLCEVVRNGTTSSARKTIRDIEIHGGVNNWDIEVREPPKSFQLDIGYLASTGKFFSLSRSNVVNTPLAKTMDSTDGNWTGVAEDFDRIYAMSGGYTEDGNRSDLKEVFEERLHRPMGSPMVTRFGLGAGGVGRDRRDFSFEVGAELVVYGATDPNAHVTLRGEPVRLQPDGTFTVRFSLPNRRQVLPVVASSGDGVEQRTIVLAVERNTKIMEPVIREPDG